jgi:hypothetical protein
VVFSAAEDFFAGLAVEKAELKAVDPHPELDQMSLGLTSFLLLQVSF